MKKEIIELITELVWKVIKHRFIVKYKQFLKYCIGGGIAFIIDIGLLYVFTEFFGLWYILSATLSFCVAAIFNYLFQKFVTFKSESKKYFKQFVMFVLIALIGLGINNSILYLLVESFGVWYILAKALAAIIVLIWNFIANKKVTFK